MTVIVNKYLNKTHEAYLTVDADPSLPRHSLPVNRILKKFHVKCL